jgi:hypothetical protein
VEKETKWNFHRVYPKRKTSCRLGIVKDSFALTVKILSPSQNKTLNHARSLSILPEEPLVHFDIMKFRFKGHNTEELKLQAYFMQQNL